MRKKKILIHSNFCKAFTGFGKTKKNVLKYLYDTGKYDLVELANSHSWSHPVFRNMPWPTYGSLPKDPNIIQQYKSSPDGDRILAYGIPAIDDIIKVIKPDIYLGIEDIWGLPFYNKKWWDKIHSVIWTTLDSVPILPQAVEAAQKTKHFFVWAKFAEKALHDMGIKHVKTLHGCMNSPAFFRLSNNERYALRRKFGLHESFVIGFVFRNQLRKSVPNLLQGFLAFKKSEPNCKAKLLLHTHWSEGWDIPKLINECGIDNNDVITTYWCPVCRQYSIRPFVGQKQDCPHCGTRGSINTTNVQAGVSESQLNEVYNLMDVYCHPFTSGGQEIPVQEAKLCELITLVTNYSCGEEYCISESGGFPLDWAEYREPGTQFIKASTYPSSICKQLQKIYNMKPEKRASLGKKAREYILHDFSTESVCQKLMELFDSLPVIDDFSFLNEPELNTSIALESLLDKDDGKRLLVVMPQGADSVIMCNSLIDSIHEQYPDFNIYFATDPQFYSLIDSHPCVHRVLPFAPIFENIPLLEGFSQHKGFFEIVFMPHITTQKVICYHHNGKDKTVEEIYDMEQFVKP